jgi:formylglycine-generating enzyme required for sulfatase activity
VNRIIAITLVAGCSGPGTVNHPGAANAQLSLAADAQMIVIPAGRFVAGSTPEERAAAYDDYQTSSGQDTAKTNKWFDGEEDRHVVTLPAYRIDLMPVTQAEYGEFVAAGKAPAPTIDEATWKAQGFTQDYASEVARFNWADGRPPSSREDHPVVLVTWTEASAYCKWRGELRGEARRLPTSAEYEKAARGDGGLAYPWGNTFEADKLDSAVKGPHDTVPVGQYTTGASQYGVLGMAGNVFEWTSTPFEGNKMMVKGSAWDDWGGVGRGASRHGRPITTRHVIIGFRCAADAPAV